MHLELANDLTANKYITVIRRLVVHTLLSDNGTNFIGANEILLKIFNSMVAEVLNRWPRTKRRRNVLGEAGVNSRPLTPVSNDPNDFTALNPGYFLTEQCLFEVTDDITEGYLTHKWQLTQKSKQQFWQ